MAMAAASAVAMAMAFAAASAMAFASAMASASAIFACVPEASWRTSEADAYSISNNGHKIGTAT